MALKNGAPLRGGFCKSVACVTFCTRTYRSNISPITLNTISFILWKRCSCYHSSPATSYKVVTRFRMSVWVPWVHEWVHELERPLKHEWVTLARDGWLAKVCGVWDVGRGRTLLGHRFPFSSLHICARGREARWDLRTCRVWTVKWHA